MAEEDPILYGGGMNIELTDGDLMFLAEDSVLVSEFELIATPPMQMEGDPNARVYFMVTFKGRINKHKELGARTVVLTWPAMHAFVQAARARMANVPLQYRSD